MNWNTRAPSCTSNTTLLQVSKANMAKMKAAYEAAREGGAAASPAKKRKAQDS